MKDIMWIGGILSFVLVFVAIGFIVIGSGIVDIYNESKAKKWELVKGQIVSCALKVEEDSDGDVRYLIDVNYLYIVNGKKYTGNKISIGYTGGSNKETQEMLLEKMISKQNIVVRYDKSNPKKSVLSYGLSGATWFKLIFGVTWILLVIGIGLTIIANAHGDKALISNIKFF